MPQSGAVALATHTVPEPSVGCVVPPATQGAGLKLAPTTWDREAMLHCDNVTLYILLKKHSQFYLFRKLEPYNSFASFIYKNDFKAHK
jgi:hypothetical protein